jgi:hypothetical protein
MITTAGKNAGAVGIINEKVIENEEVILLGELYEKDDITGKRNALRKLRAHN